MKSLRPTLINSGSPSPAPASFSFPFAPPSPQPFQVPPPRHGLAPVRSSKQDQIHASIVSPLLALMMGWMEEAGWW
ncbi:hypothetical protein EV361DRAFT_957250 [Lentinula raphanica]|nr:hypothetical protein EV361DRAFT_957250 [Lentinula raphanica]